MPILFSLSYNIWRDLINIDCNTGFNGNQYVIILPTPGQESLYHIIHKLKIYNGLFESFCEIEYIVQHRRVTSCPLEGKTRERARHMVMYTIDSGVEHLS